MRCFGEVFLLKMRRCRSLANPAVTDSAYVKCLTSFTKKASLYQLLGPALANGLHRVTPQHIVRAAPLLSSLIEAGCKNGVIFPSKMEVAVRALMADNSSASVGLPSTISAELWAAQVAEHIRVCLGMLRSYLQEEVPDKRNKTSGAFRRACSASDHIVVRTISTNMCLDYEPSGTDLFDISDGLLGTIDLGNPWLSLVQHVSKPAAGSSEASPSASSTSALVPKLALPDADDLDEHGYPKLFSRVATNTLISEEPDSARSVPSTRTYDEVGSLGSARSSAPMTSARSLATTSAAPHMPGLFDDFGFPSLGSSTDAKPREEEDEEQESEEEENDRAAHDEDQPLGKPETAEPLPLNPNSRRRKLDVLASRKTTPQKKTSPVGR